MSFSAAVLSETNQKPFISPWSTFQYYLDKGHLLKNIFWFFSKANTKLQNTMEEGVFLVKTQLLMLFQHNLESVHTTKRECFAIQAKKQQTLNLVS